jgi:putative Holliday junction resolvase
MAQILSVDELADLVQGNALLGLDPGDKTIGVAICDPNWKIASPLETIRRGKKFKIDAERLSEISTAYNAAGVIVGLPVNMDGSEGPRAQSARAFARNVSDALALPVALWDERLSTAAVTRTLLEADTSRKKRAEVVDKLAAAYILQGAIDFAARDKMTSGAEPPATDDASDS